MPRPRSSCGLRTWSTRALLATVRSDAILSDCWSSTFGFGALGETTFAVAAQSQMQRSIEDALKSKRNLGFTKKEYEASGKGTGYRHRDRPAMRYAAIEGRDALEQFNPDSDDTKRASTLLRAVHLVTSSATLNIYGKTNFPGRTAKGQAPHSDIEQLIATLRLRSHEQNSPKGLGDGQSCEAAMVAGEFQYYLLTPEERSALLCNDVDLAKTTDVARRLQVGNSPLTSANAPQYGASYGGIGVERFLPDGSLFDQRRRRARPLRPAPTPTTTRRATRPSFRRRRPCRRPAHGCLTALAPCTAPMTKPNIVAQVSAAASSGLKQRADELLKNGPSTTARSSPPKPECGCRLRRLLRPALRRAAVVVAKKAEAGARRGTVVLRSPRGPQRHPYSHTLAPRIAAAVNMARAYEATLADFELSVSHAALCSPHVSAALALTDAAEDRAARIAFCGRTDDLASNSGASQPRLLLKGGSAHVSFKATSGALLAIAAQSVADITPACRPPRSSCRARRMASCRGDTIARRHQEQLRQPGAIATRKAKTAIGKACDALASALAARPTRACATRDCAVGVSTSDPNQVAAAAKACVRPNASNLSGKQAAALAATAMLQHAQGLSGALYAAAGADPTVTARTLAGVSRTSLGGSSAQGDQTNVLDAVVATQLFATLAGIANQSTTTRASSPPPPSCTPSPANPSSAHSSAP